jgi:hypothetical protein
MHSITEQMRLTARLSPSIPTAVDTKSWQTKSLQNSEPCGLTREEIRKIVADVLG